MALKLLFWNINNRIDITTVNSLVDNILLDNNPDVFCIAEGPGNQSNLELFIDHIESKDYVSYYNPIIHFNLKTQIITGDQSHFSLKIFHKKSLKIDKFDFTKVYSSGRVVSVNFEFNSIEYCAIFIHAMSKSDKDKQDKFYSNFVDAITSISRNHKHLIIIGDFNLEPWESKLNSDSFIVSAFLRNKFDYLCKINEREIRHFNKKIFYNPIINYLESISDSDLFATFYKKDISIFDSR
jgi:exonuclease III